jgi:hypothetical protein
MTDLSLIKTFEAPDILIKENQTLKVQNKILVLSLIGIVIVGVFLVIEHHQNENKLM